MTWQLCISIITGIGLGLLGWLLIAPLVIVIDTTRKRYMLQWRGLMTARLLADGYIRLWVVGWTKLIYPWGRLARKRRNQTEPKLPQRARRRRPSVQTIIGMSRMMVRTFRVRTFDVNLDTDDYLTNAYLYPVLGLLSGPGRRLRINFRGDVSVKLIIENRPYRLLIAFIRFFLRKHYSHDNVHQ